MTDVSEDLMNRLVGLLSSWIAGDLNEREVHEAAEELLAEIGWQQFRRSDPRSATMEVLAQLDVLNQQLIISEDAPVMIEFMRGAATDADRAWRTWESYWASIDLEKRRADLAGNAYYAS
jgi:hypothetical protein